jgi:LPXTG-motif cell wall-anchored protein
MAENYEETKEVFSGRVFWLLTMGLFLIFVGFAFVVVSSLLYSGGSGSVGGVILIGPIPIVFGAGPDAGWLVLIGIIITILSLASFLLLNKRRKIYG